MTSSSSPRASTWKWRCHDDTAQAFARVLAFVLVIVQEFRRAAAATRRYDQLRRMARACDDPAASAARQIYMEFYFDG